MKGRIAFLWGIMATITFIVWCWRGWEEPGGTLICWCVIIYYGENILNKLGAKP